MPQSLFPRRRRYRTPILEAQEVLLPFVSRLPGRTYPHYWQMPPAPPTAAEAHAYGWECAARTAMVQGQPGLRGPRPAQQHRSRYRLQPKRADQSSAATGWASSIIWNC